MNIHNIPEHLKDLVPLAERWGIADKEALLQFIAQSSQCEREDLQTALKDREGDINAWLDSFSDEEMASSEEWGMFAFMMEARLQIDLMQTEDAGEDDIENYRVKLDLTKIPESLRDLVPLAEKWGIGDDVMRGELIKSASAKDKKALKKTVKERGQDIQQWLDSFSEKELSESDEWGAFSSMLEAHEEM